GDCGLLVEVDDLDAVLGLHAAVDADRPAGVVDLVPAARTLLVRFDPTQTSVAAVAAAVRGYRPVPPADRVLDEVEVAVVYDGEDLDAVGEATGLGPRGVVEAHTGQVWT